MCTRFIRNLNTKIIWLRPLTGKRFELHGKLYQRVISKMTVNSIPCRLAFINLIEKDETCSNISFILFTDTHCLYISANSLKLSFHCFGRFLSVGPARFIRSPCQYIDPLLHGGAWSEKPWYEWAIIYILIRITVPLIACHAHEGTQCYDWN